MKIKWIIHSFYIAKIIPFCFHEAFFCTNIYQNDFSENKFHLSRRSKVIGESQEIKLKPKYIG